MLLVIASQPHRLVAVGLYRHARAEQGGALVWDFYMDRLPGTWGDGCGRLYKMNRSLGHGLMELLYECIITQDGKSTRLNSSHVAISYAVVCLKKKTKTRHTEDAVMVSTSTTGRHRAY